MPGSKRKTLLACFPALGFADTPSLRRGPRSCQTRNPRRAGHAVPVPDARIWIFKMSHPVRACRGEGGRSARHRQAVPEGGRGPRGLGRSCASPLGTAPSRPSRARERCTKPRRPRHPADYPQDPGEACTPATQGERKLKQQPPHRSGRTRGSWRCLGFPQLQTPATETTLYAEHSLQTPRPGSRDRRPGRGERGGVAGLRAPPLRPLSIGLRSRLSPVRKEGLRAGAPDAGRFPWQRGPAATPSANVASEDAAWKLLRAFSGSSIAGRTTALSPTFPNL